MVQGNKRPVGNNTRDSLLSLVILMYHEIFYGGGVHHDDVGFGEDLGEEGGGEEGGVLDDDEVALVLVGDAELAEERVSGLSDNL